jgi:hypothetical protein
MDGRRVDETSFKPTVSTWRCDQKVVRQASRSVLVVR